MGLQGTIDVAQTVLPTADHKQRRRPRKRHGISLSSAPLRERVADQTRSDCLPAQPRLSHRRADAARGLPDNWISLHDPSVQLGRVRNFVPGRSKRGRNELPQSRIFLAALCRMHATLRLPKGGTMVDA
jgi:hypothetical protein